MELSYGMVFIFDDHLPNCELQEYFLKDLSVAMCMDLVSWNGLYFCWPFTKLWIYAGVLSEGFVSECCHYATWQLCENKLRVYVHGYNVIVIMAVNEIKTTLLCHCVTCLIDFWYEYFNEFCNVKSSPCPSNCNIWE